MGGGPIIPKVVQQVFSMVIYVLMAAFGMMVLGLWAIVLLNLTHVIEWPKPLSMGTAVSILGLSVVILCTIMWFGKEISVIELKESTSEKIWRLFIGSVLVTVAGAVGAAFGH